MYFLGYDKEDLKIHFLPSSPDTALSVNKTRKVLYIICELLKKEQTKQFLKYIQEDFEELGITYQSYDEDYLEMYFLKLFSERYITEYDLSNIKKIFKKMGLEKYCLWLTSLENSNNREFCQMAKGKKQKTHKDTSSPRKIFINNKINEQRFEFDNEASIISNISYVTDKYKDDECYKMDPKNPGICLIINQKFFYREPDRKLKVERESINYQLLLIDTNFRYIFHLIFMIKS